jgi:hypothetical protein
MTRNKPRTSAKSNEPPIRADTLSLGVGVGVGVEVGLATGVGVGGGRQSLPLRQKISTTSEYPLLLFCPPPKNILFVDSILCLIRCN